MCEIKGLIRRQVLDITHRSQGRVKLILKYGKDRAKLGEKTHEASSKHMSSLLLTPLSVAVVTFAFGEKVIQHRLFFPQQQQTKQQTWLSGL